MLLPNCDFRDFGRALHSTSNPQPTPPVTAPEIQDDRTDEQKNTHTRGIVARDFGMSGWGGAVGGASLCVWACAPGVDVARVLQWVANRSDMENAHGIDLDDWKPEHGAAHVHIYVCNQGHPATVG